MKKRVMALEIQEHGLKHKFETNFEDIGALRPLQGGVEILLNVKPKMYVEKVPEPGKHSRWLDCDNCDNFSMAHLQASLCRKHTLEFYPGGFERFYKKTNCFDGFFRNLINQQFPAEDHPYFEQNLYAEQNHHQIPRSNFAPALQHSGEFQVGVSSRSLDDRLLSPTDPGMYSYLAPSNQMQSNGYPLNNSIVAQPYNHLASSSQNQPQDVQFHSAEFSREPFGHNLSTFSRQNQLAPVNQMQNSGYPSDKSIVAQLYNHLTSSSQNQRQDGQFYSAEFSREPFGHNPSTFSRQNHLAPGNQMQSSGYPSDKSIVAQLYNHLTSSSQNQPQDVQFHSAEFSREPFSMQKGHIQELPYEIISHQPMQNGLFANNFVSNSNFSAQQQLSTSQIPMSTNYVESSRFLPSSSTSYEFNSFEFQNNELSSLVLQEPSPCEPPPMLSSNDRCQNGSISLSSDFKFSDENERNNMNDEPERDLFWWNNLIKESSNLTSSVLIPVNQVLEAAALASTSVQTQLDIEEEK